MEEQRKHENTTQGRDETASEQLINWDYQRWWRDALRDYQQSYAPELKRMRREMLAITPEAAEETISENWDNPSNSGEITGIQYDFKHVTVIYRIKLRKMGKLTDPLTQEEQMQAIQDQFKAKQPK
jgi:hypothetical protein